MCIRDSLEVIRVRTAAAIHRLSKKADEYRDLVITARTHNCLLYTSDAADERSSVDLGGRRIIKKKTHEPDTHTTTTI